MRYNNKSGSMFASNAQVLVHQVNCMGVMGSGVAKQVKERWPGVYEAYVQSVNTLDHNCLGGCLLVQTPDNKWIANLFSQYYYRGCPEEDLVNDDFWKLPELDQDGKAIRYTNYEAFYHGLTRLRQECIEKGLTSLAFPYKIGCDRGGADWDIIKKMITEVFLKTNMEIEIWRL